MKHSRKKTVLSLFTILFLSPVYAVQDYGNITVSNVGTVIDGDSFKVDIDQWPAIVGKSITIRINELDTPEMRGKCSYEKKLAREAKQFLVSKLRSAKVVELKNIRRGMYFRVIADVYIDKKPFIKMIESQRFYSRYGDKRDWCEN